MTSLRTTRNRVRSSSLIPVAAGGGVNDFGLVLTAALEVVVPHRVRPGEVVDNVALGVPHDGGVGEGYVRDAVDVAGVPPAGNLLGGVLDGRLRRDVRVRFVLALLVHNRSVAGRSDFLVQFTGGNGSPCD